MSKIKLVIFDCDGVLFDSKEANRKYYDHVLAQFGRPPMDEAELEYVHMHQAVDSIRHIFRRYPADFPGAEKYRATLDYHQFLAYMIMEPDLLEFLDYLRPERKTAISTNRTSTMPAVLKMFKLDGLFDMVVTALDVERPKPDPEALHRILSRFALGVEEAIYVGDSQIDREHTRSLNMSMIAFKNQELEAEYHVNSFLEIKGLGIL